jgi:hypothetical protein
MRCAGIDGPPARPAPFLIAVDASEDESTINPSRTRHCNSIWSRATVCSETVRLAPPAGDENPTIAGALTDACRTVLARRGQSYMGPDARTHACTVHLAIGWQTYTRGSPIVDCRHYSPRAPR